MRPSDQVDRIRFLFTMSNNPQAPKALAKLNMDDAAAEAVELRRDPASGGARRDRTDDLMLAKHALSQLSYGP